MLRRVLQLEEEAERGRAELAAQLEKAAQGDSKARTAAENALSMESLRLQLSSEEVRRRPPPVFMLPGSHTLPILNEEFFAKPVFGSMVVFVCYSVSVSFSSTLLQLVK